MSDIAARTPPEATLRRLTTVTAIDICGYARLAESDEAAAVRTVLLVAQAFGEIVSRRRGRLFHRAGDGFLAEFPSASDGVLAAVEIIEEMRKRDTLSPNGVAVKLRAGVHVGDVVDQPDGDLLGHGVNVASRLQAEAQPSRVLASEHAVNLVRDKIDVVFHRRGPLALKNIDKPVMVFEAERTDIPPTDLIRHVRRVTAIRPAFAAAIFFAVLLLGLNFAVLESVGSRNDDERGASHLAALTGRLIEASGSAHSSESYVDREYLTRVFSGLAASGRSADAAVLALIENGDIDKAIGALKAEVEEGAPPIERRVEILHQIGALAFERRHDEAIAAYKGILDISPNDFDAANRLGRAYVLQNNVGEARRYFALAESLEPPNERALLDLRTNKAFTYILEQDLTSAKGILLPTIDRAKALGYVDLVSRATTSLGVGLFAAGEYAEAATLLNWVVPLQEKHGYYAEEARALMVLGGLAERDGRFDAAEGYLKRSFDLQARFDRVHDMASAAAGLGRVATAKGDYPLAEAWFAKGLRIARENELSNQEFLNLVGLAQTKKRAGDEAGSCRLIRQAETVFSTRIRSQVGPIYRALIAETGCGFAALGIAPAPG